MGMVRIWEFFKKGICYGIRRGLYGPNASSKTYISYLRKKGAEIGEGTHFFNPRSVTITTNEAYLLTIGKNCQITGGDPYLHMIMAGQ